ncbi:major facilitator superfamily-domain-containing protein [Stachybotrys elegans]|uniref:Major facilitator superfamily-domain-containing protein n=1 Tax=Stachybotrys elegans TaxID=80388 RepID=A0A8K0SPM6_9HYPO|nr:major facilitator superfamily-domain-containing protein [Stachybotrys elegans]
MVSDRQTLSYPNLSLGDMTTLVDSNKNGRLPNRAEDCSNDTAQPITGVRQVMLITALDTSIASTSLVTISEEMDDFVNAPWIILAYLLTYMGFAVCISKLSDTYGRRNMLVSSWVMFVGFSLGCALAQDMIALIICRAFQGVGASGLYSLAQVGLVEVGPVHRPSIIGALIGATLAVAFVLGPLVGGLVSELSDWRWLFNMNIPFGLVAILIITSFWPHEDVASIFSWQTFTSIDFIGSTTLLFSSGFLVFAVQQAGSQTFSWQSPAIISALIISSLSWAAFVWWEVLLETRRYRQIDPIFPIKLMLRRVYASGLLITLLTGFPYISLTIIIPERFQIVNGESALMGGVHILPLLGSCAVGSFLGGAISGSRNNTSYTLIAASCLQLLGMGLMITVTGPDASPVWQYAFQSIFGLGVGLSFSAATIMTNILASRQTERASAQGAVAQARVLGGCLGLSICTVIFNLHTNQYLEGHLTEDQLSTLDRSPLSGLSLPSELRQLVRTVYADAFAEEIKVMTIVCAVMVVVSLFTWERHPAALERLTDPKEDISQPRRASDSGTELEDVVSVVRTV